MTVNIKPLVSFRRTVALVLGLMIIVACQPGVPSEEDVREASTDTSGVVFDSVLAQKLGADDYGMKVYVMALLKRGPNRSQDSTARAELQKAHLENIGRLAAEGKLVVAGPMMDDGDIRGIYVFDVSNVEEAKALTETDPAIQAGSLVMELHPWYATAGLNELADIHEKIMRISF